MPRSCCLMNESEADALGRQAQPQTGQFPTHPHTGGNGYFRSQAAESHSANLRKKTKRAWLTRPQVWCQRKDEDHPKGGEGSEGGKPCSHPLLSSHLS